MSQFQIFKQGQYTDREKEGLKLGWWIETFEGDVFEHGDAIVKLPHKA